MKSGGSGHRSPKDGGGAALWGFRESNDVGGKTAAPPRTKAVRGTLWGHRTPKSAHERGLGGMETEQIVDHMLVVHQLWIDELGYFVG